MGQDGNCTQLCPNTQMELPSRAQTNPKRGLYNDGRKHLHIYNDRPEEIGNRIKRDRDG